MFINSSYINTADFPQIANVGPADYNFEETLNTLRYANSAKNIKNKARINEDPKDAMLREFQEEIEKLKKKLEEDETSAEEEGEEGAEQEEGPENRRKRKKQKKKGILLGHAPLLVEVN